jgi:NTE family protein
VNDAASGPQHDLAPSVRQPESPRRIVSLRIALVLGGGGLKGFAHIGVLQALAEAGIRPTLYAGTSIGALVAAAGASGMETSAMADRAIRLQRRDLFRLNHVGMLLERRRTSSIYAGEPLRALCEGNVPGCSFDRLPVPVLVNTVDVERGTQVVWGLPGLRDVPVCDAVYASCALPGFFPPGAVGGRLCIDGGTIDNLPVQIAGLDADAVIAVDVGSTDLSHSGNVLSQGFAAIYMRAATAMMHSLQLVPLTDWEGPPMLLIRPRIGHVGWLSFSDTEGLIAEGYRAAREALLNWEAVIRAPHGRIFPCRHVRIDVDRAKCTGCGMCVALAPDVMRLDASGKARALSDVQWSPADGDFIHQCPVNALSTQTLAATEHGRRSSAERRRELERRSSGGGTAGESEEVA